MTKVEKVVEVLSEDINITAVNQKQLNLTVQRQVMDHLEEKGFEVDRGTLLKFANLLAIKEDPTIDNTIFQMSIGVAIEPVTLEPVISIGGYRPEKLQEKKKYANVTYNRVEDVLDIMSSREFQSTMNDGTKYSTYSAIDNTDHYNYTVWQYNIPFNMQEKGLDYRLQKLDTLIERFFTACRLHGLEWIPNYIESNRK